MRWMKTTLEGLALGAMLSACGGGAEQQRSISGTLDLTALGRTEARLIATSAGGERIEQRAGSDGRFELELETEKVWAIAFAGAEQGDDRVFANLVFGPAERRSGRVRIVAGEALDMGSVEPVGEDASTCRHLGEDGGGMGVVPSFLVAAENDLAGSNAADDTQHADDHLRDRDGDGRPDALDEDDDDDGLCDDDDDDGFGDGDAGEDDGDDGDDTRAELPYDVKLAIGQEFQLMDAFLEKGAAPAEILSVQMDGSSWRLSELRSNTRFTVEQSDCDHRGNRDTGRDRAFIAWRNADGTTDLDHLDLRYCED